MGSDWIEGNAELGGAHMGGALGTGLAGDGGDCRLGGGGALALAPTGRLGFLHSRCGPAGPASPPLAHHCRLCMSRDVRGVLWSAWRGVCLYYTIARVSVLAIDLGVLGIWLQLSWSTPASLHPL